MMRIAPIRRFKGGSRPSEEGFILVSVMFLLALLIIAMAVALPKISADIQRDREVETMHRGKQYRRAIQLYYRKFNRYPPNLDALVKTNELRFLRKKYVDPTTGKAEWKPIMFGQNKTPLAMGFFGQPLGGAVGGLMGGAGVAGTNGGMGVGNTMGTSSNSPFGSSTSSFGSSTSSFGSSTSSIGSSTSSPTGGTDTSSGTTGASGTTGTGGTTGTTDANGNPVDPSTQPSGPTFGGAGIIGVSPMSPKQSILLYKKKNHYNEWEFLYSPLSEQGMIPNSGPTPIASSPGVGVPTSPTSPTTPTTPTTPTDPTSNPPQ